MSNKCRQLTTLKNGNKMAESEKIQKMKKEFEEARRSLDEFLSLFVDVPTSNR